MSDTPDDEARRAAELEEMQKDPEAVARLVDAVFNTPEPEEQVAALRAEWEETPVVWPAGSTGSPARRLAYLEALVAYLAHALADSMALLDIANGDNGDREEMAEFNALDFERGALTYAVDSATHGEAPTYAWYSEGRPEPEDVTRDGE